ncbi:hypothetical protein [Acinetobacter tianfuensis]|uniref:Uncharacterized protein n=1 Tax=Acinetobacter tianfuensis TaxID=2419603 RepID=A0A3A8EAX1_9GAMM|nr:hypothetical protein [Acinetobacter tianfuensis]RKG31319.1 hypothetical protein D7V32_08755 [Acinetobacter tianfuensis]
MNALDKALLIKELHGLLIYLDNRSLNLFEIAKTKNRIKEIFSLCDDPIFQKQQLEFKLRLNPKTISAEFAKNSLYALSFLGYYTSEEELYEQHASVYRSIGWAFLHLPHKGWKICVHTPQIEAPWHTSWGTLDAAYAQMLHNQTLHGLLIDSELLKSQSAAPNMIQAKQAVHIADPRSPLIFNEIPAQPETESTAETSSVNHESEHAGSAADQDDAPIMSDNDQTAINTKQHVQPANSAENLQPNILHADLFEIEVKQASHAAGPVAAIEITAADMPVHEDKEEPAASAQPISLESIKLFNLTADVTVLLNDAVKDETLCLLSLRGMPEVSQHVEILMLLACIESWQHMPVIIAELLSANGQFFKYALLFGANEQSHAMRILNQYCRQQNLSLAAIKQISLSGLGMDFTDEHLLFQAYQQRAKLFWSIEPYYPFISSYQLQSQKFILFDETPAELQTPILLLQERHKIRVIHGENRIALNRSERAYPYLMLHRQHNMTWQRIHAVILELPQPIDVLTLYHALTQDKDS